MSNVVKSDHRSSMDSSSLRRIFPTAGTIQDQQAPNGIPPTAVSHIALLHRLNRSAGARVSTAARGSIALLWPRLYTR
jgi:hypothetical protein